MIVLVFCSIRIATAATTAAPIRRSPCTIPGIERAGSEREYLMAKQRMRCVFSEQLCRECPLFRGRHYYLCFTRTYRGYLGAEPAAREASDSCQPLFGIEPIQHQRVIVRERRRTGRPDSRGEENN